MDHTPGQRQWRNLADLKTYTIGGGEKNESEFDRDVALRLEQGPINVAANRPRVIAMFRDSGYRIESSTYVIAGDLAQLFEEHRGKQRVSVRRGRVQLTDLTAEEFRELCSIQILLVASSLPPESAA